MAKKLKGHEADSRAVEHSRKQDFHRVTKALGDTLRFASERALLAHGDSLELMKRLPDHCVSLILTDPPYHTTKKHNIVGDTSFEHDQHYLEWMSEYATEWKRILKANGSLFCFCASEMAARLEVLLSREFNILAQVVWTKPNEPGFDGWKQKMKKEALRQWYAHSERIVFAEPACEGNLHRSPFAEFLRATRKKAGMTAHELAEITGAYGKVNHGGAVSNWETGRNIPSRDQYARICEALEATGRIGQMPPYEDVIRPFAVDANTEFTDVWTFMSVRPYKGKHPAEKPNDMLEHAILATTFPGDLVLDCFAGSGSTALAALRTGRRTVAIEIDDGWVDRIATRLEAVEDVSQLPTRQTRLGQTEELPLFSDTK